MAKFTEEHRRNLSLARKGKPSWNKGLKLSSEHKKRLSESHKGKNGLLGKKRPEISGEKHFAWKGGYENTLFRNRRRKAMKKGNGGRHTHAEWLLLKRQCDNRCVHCQKQELEIELTQDHIIPLTRGGTDNIENIQPLCRGCNSRKGNKMPEVAA